MDRHRVFHVATTSPTLSGIGRCLQAAVAVLVLPPLLAERAAAGESPNVVLLLADDLGWGDTGFNGSDVVETPHLDRMAANGLRFARFYAAAPVCSPTRGSVLTGRHPYRYEIPFANRGHMKDAEITLAEALKTRGYATGHFGKWHLGTLTTQVRDSNRGRPGKTQHYETPAMHGFDVYFSTEAKVPTWDPMLFPKEFGEQESRRYGWVPVEGASQARAYGTRYWNGEERIVTENLAGDDSRVIMDRVLPFIERAAEADRPFVAVVWFHAPHLPVVTGKRYRELYAERPLREQLYYGCITAMDAQVGRLRKALREQGVAEETMVWFASDNGPENGTPGSPGPFRGRKRSLYEGGVRGPAVLEWPAKIAEPCTTDIPCVTSDYYPTVLDVLEIEMPDQPEPLDGVSLLPLIEGRMDSRPRPIGFQSRGTATWCDNRFKLVMKRNGKAVELYDLIEDPAETTNIAGEQPQRVQRMKRALRAWQKSCAASAEGKDYQ